MTDYIKEIRDILIVNLHGVNRVFLDFVEMENSFINVNPQSIKLPDLVGKKDNLELFVIEHAAYLKKYIIEDIIDITRGNLLRNCLLLMKDSLIHNIEYALKKQGGYDKLKTSKNNGDFIEVLMSFKEDADKILTFSLRIFDDETWLEFGGINLKKEGNEYEGYDSLLCYNSRKNDGWIGGHKNREFLNDLNLDSLLFKNKKNYNKQLRLLYDSIINFKFGD